VILNHVAPVANLIMDPPLQGSADALRDERSRLLGDAIRHDLSLFGRWDAIEAQWAIVQPVLGEVTPVYEYPCGSWGPHEAVRLTETDDGWINPQA